MSSLSIGNGDIGLLQRDYNCITPQADPVLLAAKD
jgi:hypothetical protein